MTITIILSSVRGDDYYSSIGSDNDDELNHEYLRSFRIVGGLLIGGAGFYFVFIVATVLLLVFACTR